MEQGLTCFCTFQAESQTWPLDSYGTHLPTLWTIPMTCKRSLIADLVTCNAPANSCNVCAEFSSNSSCNSASWNFRGWPGRCLSSKSKSPHLNRLNQYSHVFIDGDKSQQANDDFQLHFSSDPNRKIAPPADAVLLVRGSTFTMLLFTLIWCKWNVEIFDRFTTYNIWHLSKSSQRQANRKIY